MNECLEDYKATGNDLNMLYKEINNMAKRTECLPISLSSFDVMSYCGITATKQHLTFFNMSEKYEGQELDTSNLSIPKLMTSITKEELHEMIDTGLFLRDSESIYKPGIKSYFLSKWALSTLLPKIGLGGPAMAEHSIVRDLQLANIMKTTDNQFLNILVRTSESGRPKIFAFLGGRSTPPSFSILTDMIHTVVEYYPNAKLYNWEITNKYINVYFDLPDSFTVNEDTYIPGIKLTFSDVGYKGITVSSTLRLSTPTVISTKEISVKDKVETVMHKFFTASETERAKFIAGIQCLSERKYADEEEQALIACTTQFNSVMKYSELSKIIGVKRLKMINKNIKTLLPNNREIVASDICSIVMHMPENIVFSSESARTKLENGCGHALKYLTK